MTGHHPGCWAKGTGPFHNNGKQGCHPDCTSDRSNRHGDDGGASGEGELATEERSDDKSSPLNSTRGEA